jgi:hypothetical protein
MKWLGGVATGPLAAVLFLLTFSSIAQAEIIWGPNSTATSLANINANGGILVGDKRFTDFAVTSSGNATILPTISDIMLSGLTSGDYGVEFNYGWFALPGQLLDTKISYAVEVAAATAPFKIEDNLLAIEGVGTRGNGAFATVVENVFSSKPPHATSIADQFVYYASSSDQLLSDHDVYAQTYSKLWVVKDITLYGGTGHSVVPGVTLSAVLQTFSQTQVPEPQSLVLLFCGLPGLAMMAWRRYRA